MTFPELLYVQALVFSACTLALLGLYILRVRGGVVRVRYGAAALFSASIWTFAYALELGSPNLGAKIFWNKFQWIGISSLPTLWLLYILCFTGRERWLTAKNLVVASVIPIITLLLVFTNEYHGLIWPSIEPMSFDGLEGVVHNNGIWLNGYIVYSYCLGAVSAFFIIQMMLGQRAVYRQQLLIVLLAVVIVSMSRFLNQATVLARVGLDIEPFALAIAGVLVSWALFRLRFGDALPIAHKVVVQGLTDCVMALDENDRVLEANDAMARLLAKAPSELLGKALDEVWPNRPIPNAGEHTPSAAVCEFVETSGDEERIYDMRVSPLLDSRKKAMGKVLVLRNITAHKKMEAELKRLNEMLDRRVQERTRELVTANRLMGREIEAHRITTRMLTQSKEQWERTFNAVKNPIAVVDSSLSVSRLNQAAVEAYGEQCLDMPCHKAFFNESEPCPDCPARVLPGFGPVLAHEWERRHGQKVLRMAVAPILGGEGEPQGFVCQASDITGHKALEGQLRQAQKMDALGTLARGVAHDFNNLLTTIILNVEHAGKKAQPGSDLEKSVGIALGSALYAKNLVGRILTFSKPSEEPLASVPVIPAIREALSLVRASAAPSIEFTADYAAPDLAVRASRPLLDQVVINLCSNAVQAMGAGPGRLLVRVDRCENVPRDSIFSKKPSAGGRMVRIRIQDTGPGIPGDIMDSIFDPFFTTRKNDGGSGLGLSVVLGIVRTLEGAVRVENLPGQGAVFEVFLPEARLVLEEAKPLSAMAEKRTGRVLVVDDQDHVLFSLHRTLTEAGFSVSAYQSGREAVKEFARAPDSYDLVLTDLTMPEMSGLGVARAIRELRDSTPVVLLSGYSDTVDRLEALADGITAILNKPVTGAALSDFLSGVLIASEDDKDKD